VCEVPSSLNANGGWALTAQVVCSTGVAGVASDAPGTVGSGVGVGLGPNVGVGVTVAKGTGVGVGVGVSVAIAAPGKQEDDGFVICLGWASVSRTCNNDEDDPAADFTGPALGTTTAADAEFWAGMKAMTTQAMMKTGVSTYRARRRL
jgi:hypothetical protein